MKIHVDLKKGIENVSIIIMILDTEDKTLANKLFRSPLDYPSNKDYVYVENVGNCEYIENVFRTEEGAKSWVEFEIKCLKNKLCLDRYKN